MINKLFLIIKYYLRLVFFKNSWRKINKHNFTTAGSVFPIDRVSVGNKTYGSINVRSFGNDLERLVIGSYCSIAGDVKFLLGGEHNYKSLSTYPFKVRLFGEKTESISKGPIIIKDDVWIGERCLILSGVTIGQGAIIGTGSVVFKDIPPYAIYGGGEIIKYRFTQDIIEKLKEFDYSKLKEREIIDNINTLYNEVNAELLEKDFVEKCMRK